MTLISKFVILSLLVTLFYFIGLLTFITDYEENKCEMTYMFEYPQFVKIQMPLEESFPRYGLFVYSEGKLTEKARAMKFEGIPVLFVPGNAGSYKQVRSLASVALRKALNSRVGYHFDFFTLDLNGELSGLNGAVLEDQTRFLNHSLHRILDLYERKRPGDGPNSVIVIGHSMGGVIGQSILDSSLVNMLITLASPHKRPTVSLDSYTAQYYNNIAKMSNFTGEHKTLISIGGGYQDHIVNSWLTNSNFSSLNTITTTIPTVWLSVDHACITWCKQLILTIIRALFDAVDLKTKQISLDAKYRTAVFKHHLLQNSGTNIRWADRYKVLVRFDDRGQWFEDTRRQYTIYLPKGAQNNQWHMVAVTNESNQQALFVQANNLAVSDWIFACEADKRRGNVKYCDTGIHLSQISKIAPSTKLKRRTHYANLVTLKKRFPKITHVVVRVLPTQEPVSLNFDIHSPADRLTSVQLPRWFSLARTNIIPQTQPGALRYEINLNGLQHIIQSYLLYVEPINCEEELHHATVSLSVPWANHDSSVYITETQRKPLSIRLHGSRPSKYANLTARAILTLDPKCQYTISVRNSFLGMLGQFARFYSPLLVANIVAVILMSYRSQLISLEENKYCSLFQASLSMSTKPYYLVTSAKLLSKVLTIVKLPHLLPVPDTQILVEENIDFLLLPLLLYVTSVGLTYLMTLGLWAGIIMNESTVHKFVGKAFSRTFGKSFRMSDWFINAMHRVPCVVAATLFCLGLTTCGGLALCLGVCYYFLKLSQLGEDFVEGLIYRHVKKVAVNIVKNLFKNIGKLLFKRFMKKEQIKDAINNEGTKEHEHINQKQMLNDKLTSEETKDDQIGTKCEEIDQKHNEILIKKTIDQNEQTGTAEQIKQPNDKLTTDDQEQNSDKENYDQNEQTGTKEIETKCELKQKKVEETNIDQKDEQMKQNKVTETKDDQSKDIGTKGEQTEQNDKLTKKTKDDQNEQTRTKAEHIKQPNDKLTTDDQEQNSDKESDEVSLLPNETEQTIKTNDTNSLRLRKVHLNNDLTAINEPKTEEQLNTESEIHKTVQQMFEAPDNTEMHFHFTLFLLWFIVAALNVPSVLTWAHNFKYNNILSPDPSKLFSIVMCACAVPLWQFEFPKPNKKFYKELGMFIYAMAILCLVYGPLNLYRLSYIISATFVVTLIHQIFAPSYPEEETTEEKIDPIALIKEIKSKLE